MPVEPLKFVTTYTARTQPTILPVMAPMRTMVSRHLDMADMTFKVIFTAGFFRHSGFLAISHSPPYFRVAGAEPAEKDTFLSYSSAGKKSNIKTVRVS